MNPNYTEFKFPAIRGRLSPLVLTHARGFRFGFRVQRVVRTVGQPRGGVPQLVKVWVPQGLQGAEPRARRVLQQLRHLRRCSKTVV